MLFFFAVLGSSVAYRLRNAKPILRPTFSELRFSETWVSGRSDRSALARLLGASHFLWVVVAADTLHVSPHLPFNLMFLPEAFGWDHRVPARTISEVREVGGRVIGNSVLIRYRHKTGDEELLELNVLNASQLIRALQAASEG